MVSGAVCRGVSSGVMVLVIAVSFRRGRRRRAAPSRTHRQRRLWGTCVGSWDAPDSRCAQCTSEGEMIGALLLDHALW